MAANEEGPTRGVHHLCCVTSGREKEGNLKGTPDTQYSLSNSDEKCPD